MALNFMITNKSFEVHYVIQMAFLMKHMGKFRENLLNMHLTFFIKMCAKNILQKWGEKYIYPAIQHKFRHSRDVLFTMLHHYYVIHEGSKCCGFGYEMLDDPKYDTEMVLYRVVDDHDELEKQFNHIRYFQPKFFALNDVFNNYETADKLKSFLEELYPEPSSFELKDK